MKFIVPTNFQEDLIPRLNKNSVYSIYGKLNSDCVGGGRPSFILPFVSRKNFAGHVRQAHQNGLEFNYLLNSVCLGNIEFSACGQKKIRSLLEWLVKIKVDGVTVAVPYLAQLIKSKYPHLKIYASACANIDSLIKARYWQDLGVDTITLQSTALNRDFKTLNQIRKHISCKLSLLVNDTCLYNCPLSYYHNAGSSHASQSGNRKGYYVNYWTISCKLARIQDPVNIIRAVWIRPEDVHYYEAIGIDYLKIAGRNTNTDFILNVVNAYTLRRYEGNLADIFPMYHKRFNQEGIKKYLHYIRYVFKPFVANVLRVPEIFKEEPLEVYIDNRALDGFLEFFVQGNCKIGLCDECGYCKKIAQKSVRINKKYQEEFVIKYKNMLGDIVSGKVFKYF